MTLLRCVEAKPRYTTSVWCAFLDDEQDVELRGAPAKIKLDVPISTVENIQLVKDDSPTFTQIPWFALCVQDEIRQFGDAESPVLARTRRRSGTYVRISPDSETSLSMSSFPALNDQGYPEHTQEMLSSFTEANANSLLYLRTHLSQMTLYYCAPTKTL